jgi:hypothetical protein
MDASVPLVACLSSSATTDKVGRSSRCNATIHAASTASAYKTRSAGDMFGGPPADAASCRAVSSARRASHHPSPSLCSSQMQMNASTTSAAIATSGGNRPADRARSNQARASSLRPSS